MIPNFLQVPLSVLPAWEPSFGLVYNQSSDDTKLQAPQSLLCPRIVLGEACRACPDQWAHLPVLPFLTSGGSEHNDLSPKLHNS